MPTCCRPTSGSFKYILVDEYQDTNVAQYLWLRLLAQRPSQPLLRRRRRPVDLWLARRRGRQHPALRERFPGRQHHPAGAQLPLHPPHPRRRLRPRSPTIEGRLGKTLWTESERWARRWRVQRPVGRRGGGALRRRRGRGVAAQAARRSGQIAILVRAGFQTREFEERFITLGVPYRVIGGPRFYERQEIRDAIAYLRVLHQPDRRSRLRAHRQHAAPRHRRSDRASDPQPGARQQSVSTERGGRAPDRDRRAEGGGAQGAGRAAARFRALAQLERGHAAGRTGRSGARRGPATPPCGRPTSRRRRRAASRT